MCIRDSIKAGDSPIVPVMLYNAKLAQDVARDLYAEGFIPAMSAAERGVYHDVPANLRAGAQFAKDPAGDTKVLKHIRDGDHVETAIAQRGIEIQTLKVAYHEVVAEGRSRRRGFSIDLDTGDQTLLAFL